jgi:hypothetical protein
MSDASLKQLHRGDVPEHRMHSVKPVSDWRQIC